MLYIGKVKFGFSSDINCLAGKKLNEIFNLYNYSL